jgi:hypothetical protein
MGYMAGLGIEEGPGFGGCILLMGRSGGCYFDHTSLGGGFDPENAKPPL